MCYACSLYCKERLPVQMLALTVSDLTCYDACCVLVAILQPRREPRTRKARSTSSNLCNARVLRVLVKETARHNDGTEECVGTRGSGFELAAVRH